MARFRNPANGDVVTVPDVLVAKYEKRDHERLPDGPAEELRGEALDQALTDAGLSKSGTADEKRARLAEHIANTEE